jgi:hypothetical protein
MLKVLEARIILLQQQEMLVKARQYPGVEEHTLRLYEHFVKQAIDLVWARQQVANAA